MKSKATSIQTMTLALVLALPAAAQADRKWDEANDPANFSRSYIKDFSRLPLNGEMDHGTRRGWSDSYWPKVRGSIASRWQVPETTDKEKNLPQYKRDKSPGYYELSRMTESQINLLSPAEKFDLARGKLDFPMATEIRKTFKKREEDWRGLCNGWTHASLNYAEPNPIVYVDPRSGRKIPFGSGDIKGLLAYYHAVLDNADAQYIGKSCRSSNRLFGFGSACSDVHPAALHIMMANELGLKHQGFAADRDPTTEVWNQPFVKFESRIDNIISNKKDISKKATEGTRKEVYITSTLTYVNESYDTTNPLEETAVHATPSYYPLLEKTPTRTIEYKYLLELNSRDQIIGGEWISDMRPDLIWRQEFKAPGMTYDGDKKDDWSLLSELVKMATEAIPGNSN